VLAWQLVNEQWMFAHEPPLSLTEGTVRTTTGTHDMADPEQKARMIAEGVNHYIAQMKDEILRHDPGALVTMGFFHHRAEPAWRTDPASAIAGSALDFVDFHAYPGSQPMAWYIDGLGLDAHPEMPVLLGEFGAFRHIHPDIEAAAAAPVEWQRLACEAGFDGFLYWTYRSDVPDAHASTWGLTDEDGFLLELLAPRHRPDACAGVTVPRANLALGARPSASRALPEGPPRAAIDDDAETVWVAGEGPEQWIALRFPRPVTIGEVQLIVSQHPPGRTRHVVEVRRRGGAGWQPVAELAGRTADPDRLVVRPKRPLRRVTALRVRTLASPSWVAWREVRAFERPQGEGG
jgi:hypothetical protein